MVFELPVGNETVEALAARLNKAITDAKVRMICNVLDVEYYSDMPMLEAYSYLSRATAGQAEMVDKIINARAGIEIGQHSSVVNVTLHIDSVIDDD